MQFATTRFGTIDVPPEEVIKFPAGLPGFEDARRFVTIEDPAAAPFVWLQSLECPELAFLTICPLLFVPDYSPEISDEARQALCWTDDAEVEVLAIVTVPDDPRLMTANLRAPVLINRRARLGRQEVGAQGKYPLRYRLLPEGGATRDKAAAGR